jgi:ATP-dependent Clp protease ATP-binding subunit ClpA
LVGRDEEIRQIIEVLCRHRKNSPVLVGESGVGKTSIVRGLANRIVNGDVPDALQRKKLVELDIGSLIAGTKDRGEVQQRFKLVLDEIRLAADSPFILIIDELHGFVGDQNELGGLLKSALDAGELQCVGVATPSGYKTQIETDVALARRLQPIFISEPTIEDTVAILRALKHRYETHHGVRISDSALIAASTLSQRYRYAGHRFLPDKAIDLVDTAAAHLKVQLDKPEELEYLDRQIVRLKIEQVALSKLHDVASKEQLRRLQKDLAALQEKADALTAKWKLEKIEFVSAVELQKQLDKAKLDLSDAIHRGDYQTAGELQYGRIPRIETKLRTAEMRDDVVTPYAVKRVIAKETGIPFEQILEDEAKPDKEPEAEKKVSPSGRIFISYRRDDVAGHAGRIHDRLTSEFGTDLVFIDVDSISFGSDFVKVLDDMVGQCEVLVAVIGPNWLDAKDAHGNRRIDDPKDFVRIEVAAALHRNIAIIPILLPNTTMPRADQLPSDLEGLTRRQALEVRHVSFKNDMDRLVRILKDLPQRKRS